MKKIILISMLWIFNANLSAQIATDGTLGSAQKIEGLQNLEGLVEYQIGENLGKQNGGNLFHSFQSFNLEAGEIATFSGPETVQNVISRVTGDNPSLINGTIRSTIPNFYFLNPYGIMFGPNASLNVPGSFYASTTDSLFFTDGSSFSTTENVSSPILTVAAPEAFGFLEMPPAPLSIYDSLLEVKKNQALFLLGSPLTITNATVFAPYGDINLVGLNELKMTNSTVYAPAGKIGLFTTALQNVIPTSFETLAAGGLEGGTINIIDNLFERLGIFYTHIESSSALWESWDLRPNENKQVANLDTNGEGGGKIVIRSGQFFLEAGSIYADNYFGNSDGGGIDIEVQGKMRLTKSARITAGAMKKLGENVRGGDISITAGKLEIGELSNEQMSFMVRALLEGPIEFEQQFGIDKQAYFRQLDINEQETAQFLANLQMALFELSQQSEISLYAIWNKMNENDEKYMNEKYAMAISYLFEDILNTIGTKNFGVGNGGNITINTPILDAEQTLIETATKGGGSAGNIYINAQKIKLSDYSWIDASTVSLGQAGDIKINGNDSFFLSNFSSITTSTSQNSMGQAGNISLNARELTLDFGQINSFSEGDSDAGLINITADFARLNKSRIHTSAEIAGGGDITLNISDHFYVTDSSRISAKALGSKPQDSGGNITIGKKLSLDPKAPWENTGIFTLKNSRLLANAYAGNGGEIQIYTDDFQGENSKVDVSSTLGLNGNFYVNEIRLSDNFLAQNREFLDEDEKVIDNRCLGFNAKSRFLIIQGDTLQQSPMDLKTHLPFVGEEI